MSALRIEPFDAAPGALEAFERVRDAIGIHPPGSAEPVPSGTRCLIAWRGESPVARCTTSVAPDLRDAPGSSGLIGHYEALDAEAGVAVLNAACRTLADRQVARVLGPMNGSTWARYRLVLPAEPGEPPAAPPFLAEPWNPPRYVQDFADAGFEVEARYESRVDEGLERDAEDAAALAATVAASGIQVRPLDLSRFDRELETLFEISVAAFAGNLYYTPIGVEAFRAQYQKARAAIDPELVLIAEDGSGVAVAFQFAFVDPLSPAGAPPRAVVKTVATAPAARGQGLAGHLLDRIRARAREAGCGCVIHALMHVRNFSMRMSARHHSRVFRRYALFRWMA